jgi:hypothetical protein
MTVQTVNDPFATFKAEIQEFKLALVEQAGKLEFEELDAKARLARIELLKAENRTHAANLLAMEADIRAVEAKLAFTSVERKM